jgi:hypothetical protein
VSALYYVKPVIFDPGGVYQFGREKVGYIKEPSHEL